MPRGPVAFQCRPFSSSGMSFCPFPVCCIRCFHDSSAPIVGQWSIIYRRHSTRDASLLHKLFAQKIKFSNCKSTKRIRFYLTRVHRELFTSPSFLIIQWLPVYSRVNVTEIENICRRSVYKERCSSSIELVNRLHGTNSLVTTFSEITWMWCKHCWWARERKRKREFWIDNATCFLAVSNLYFCNIIYN